MAKRLRPVVTHRQPNKGLQLVPAASEEEAASPLPTPAAQPSHLAWLNILQGSDV